MKRVITAVILLLLVVAACFGSYRYITNATTAVRDALAVTQQSVEAGILRPHGPIWSAAMPCGANITTV